MGLRRGRRMGHRKGRRRGRRGRRIGRRKGRRKGREGPQGTPQGTPGDAWDAAYKTMLTKIIRYGQRPDSSGGPNDPPQIRGLLRCGDRRNAAGCRPAHYPGIGWCMVRCNHLGAVLDCERNTMNTPHAKINEKLDRIRAHRHKNAPHWTYGILTVCLTCRRQKSRWTMDTSTHAS